jgi:hypothetical protein
MESLHVSSDTTGAENFDERGGRSPLVMVVAIIAALALTGSLFAGYMFLKRRHAAQVNAQRQAETAAAATKPAAPPELQVFVDDAMLKGSQTVIGGTLLNISRETISDLSVELELRPRKGGSPETRPVTVEPKDLAPNQQGRYSLKLATQDYSHARLLRITSGARTEEVAFKTAPGAQRPPEVIKPEVKTIIVKPPPKRSNGEEFINTPDTPAKIH